MDVQYNNNNNNNNNDDDDDDDDDDNNNNDWNLYSAFLMVSMIKCALQF